MPDPESVTLRAIMTIDARPHRAEVPRGETFQASAQEARDLIRHGRAEVPPRPERKRKTAAPEAEAE